MWWQEYGLLQFRPALLNPSRDPNASFGARQGALARCPVDPATKKVKLPEAGKHCDSVPGMTLNPPDAKTF